MAQRGDGLPQPIPGVLDPDERIGVEQRFGVAAEQVVRDHVISHALAAIGSIGTDDVVFFGGTALSRTHLGDVRLSEGIDLIARGDRGELGDTIEAAIVARFRRTFGTVTFTPRIRDTRHPNPAVTTGKDSEIEISLASRVGVERWAAVPNEPSGKRAAEHQGEEARGQDQSPAPRRSRDRVRRDNRDDRADTYRGDSQACRFDRPADV